MENRDVKALNPVQLAFMGDAVCGAYVRERLLARVSPVKSLHRRAVECVNAAGQSEALARIEPLLTEDERDVVRRGRNAKTGSPPRSASPADYARATAFEALLGYLHLSGGGERLRTLLDAAYPMEGGGRGAAEP